MWGLRRTPERELEGVRAKGGPKETPVPFFSVERWPVAEVLKQEMAGALREVLDIPFWMGSREDLWDRWSLECPCLHAAGTQ